MIRDEGLLIIWGGDCRASLRDARNDPAPNHGRSLLGTGQAGRISNIEQGIANFEVWIPAFAGMTI